MTFLIAQCQALTDTPTPLHILPHFASYLLESTT